MELTTLLCERDGAVATVTLNRPDALNALNAAMLEELGGVFAELAADAAVRVILLTGAGPRAFAAGADIRELLGTDAVTGRAVSERGQTVFNLIERCGKPVIAALNGAALGGGLELALACTLRVAADTAVLGMPEAKLGLIPGFGGVHRLIRQIGRGQALRLMLPGQSVKADEALRLGLVEEVVPAGELIARARGLAQTIAGLAPLAVAGVLVAVGQGEGRSMDEGFAAEQEVFAELCGTADKREGLTAFVEKRAAVWRGK